jgi:phosphoadenosine phosphosulfate reductase
MNLINDSLKIISIFHDPRKANIISFSGGKDSIVLLDLALKTGLNFNFIYGNTTIDPPGHISFIRHNFPMVEISHPKISFYDIIEKYGLPTRFRRNCCFILKEYIGKESNCYEGLRIDEGQKRGARLKLLKIPSTCDTRVKNKTHVYPLLNWSSKDIWNYIHNNGLIYPEIYNSGLKRLGCVGCPLATKSQRISDYKLYPKITKRIIKAIKTNIDNKKSISKYFNDEYKAFYWWLSTESIDNFYQPSLFTIDYKSVIIDTFNLSV